MANLAIRLQPETVRTLGFAAILPGYVAVGTALANPARILILNNLTDENLMFSFDGVNDHIAVAGPGSFVLDITSNKGVAGGLFLAQGTTIFVREIGNPTLGAVYVSVFFGDRGF